MIFQSSKTCSYFLVMIMALMILSCKQIDVYEHNIPIANYKWQQKDTLKGSFIISDTTASYNIYIVLRHTDAYMYNNLWLNVGLKTPGDSMFFQHVNLTLGADASGWEGTGMNDIWEARKPLFSPPRRFKKSGEYKFSITHIMRDNPLLNMMSAGLRVQKVN